MTTPNPKRAGDSTGRKLHLPLPSPVIGETVAGAGDNVARPVLLPFKRQLHIFVCALLGLDDEDHADDDEAEPVEKALTELFELYTAELVREARVEEAQYIWGHLPLGKNIHGNFYYTGPDLDKYYGERIAALQPKGQVNKDV